MADCLRIVMTGSNVVRGDLHIMKKEVGFFDCEVTEHFLLLVRRGFCAKGGHGEGGVLV